MKKKFRPVSPWGPQWKFMAGVLRKVNGEDLLHQLWRNKKTGETKWYRVP